MVRIPALRITDGMSHDLAMLAKQIYLYSCLVVTQSADTGYYWSTTFCIAGASKIPSVPSSVLDLDANKDSGANTTNVVLHQGEHTPILIQVMHTIPEGCQSTLCSTFEASRPETQFHQLSGVCLLCLAHTCSCYLCSEPSEEARGT